MFKALFLATLLITLVVNIIFLLATKDKPPDLSFEGADQSGVPTRRLFLRSNYDYYSSSEPTASKLEANSSGTTSGSPLSRLLNNPTNTESEIEPPARSDTNGRPDDLTSDGNKGDNQADSESNDDDNDDIANADEPKDNEISLQGGAQKPARRALNIVVKSSKDHVLVSLDGRPIYESASVSSGQAASKSGRELEDEASRGLHVLVLNQRSGEPMSRRRFDTYSPSHDEELATYLDSIRAGRLLVLAVKDEASFKMPLDSPARRLIEQLGSRHIMKLQWRDMWAIVLRKKQLLDSANISSENVFAEALTRSSRFSDWAPPVQLEVQVELDGKTEEEQCQMVNPSESSYESLRRIQFCAKIEGYGRLCDCHEPAPISFHPEQYVQPNDHWKLSQMPIVVMASNRPYYLNRMLRSLLQARGLNRSMVSVFIDGAHEEPLQVARLYELRAVQQRARGRRSARISHHYLQSLSHTFGRLYPEATHAIIFEEDLEVAPDALVYFNQTLDILERDPSLYCSSAWNDQGYQHTVGDPRRVYRIETMPGLGWLLSRRLFERELQPQWPSPSQSHDWDMWIRTKQVRKGRECLIPDVSRTYHFGASGTNINAYFQRQYFSKHAFQAQEPVLQFAQLDQLLEANYERLMESLVAGAKPVEVSRSANVSQFLCSLASGAGIANSTRNDTQPLALWTPSRLSSEGQQHDVIYISMIDDRHFANWLVLAGCWRIWDLDARGQHKSTWRLYLAGRPTLVVGVPASPYSRFKPAHLEPFSLVAQSAEPGDEPAKMLS